MRRAVTVAGGCAWAVVLGLAISCSDEDDGNLVGGGATGATGGRGATGGSNAAGAAGDASGGDAGSGAGGNGTGGSMSLPPCESFGDLDAECGQNTVAATQKVVNALLVIDKSGSMEDPLGDSDTQKWDALKEALGDALPAVEDRLNFGVLLYPSPGTMIDCAGDECCNNPVGNPAVNVDVAPGAISNIMNSLDSTGPGGGTPTAAALSHALEYYTTGAGALLEGEKYVVLATDGGPNCNDKIPSCEADVCTRNLDQSGSCTPDGESCCEGSANISCLDNAEVEKQIQFLQDAGIPTFVIGLPGSEAYAQYLDDFAEIGGVANPDGPPSYFAVDAAGGVEGLTQVFTDITNQLVRSCDIELSQEPEDREKVNVAVDCTPVPPDDSTSGSGWDYVDESGEPLKIRLRGGVCDYVKNEGAMRVDVLFGCATIDPVR